MPTPGAGCRLCPGLPPASLLLEGASGHEAKGQDRGLAAVPLTPTCSPRARWPAGLGVQAGSAEQPVPRAAGPLAPVTLCLPGTSSKRRPVRGNFQPER